MPSQAARVRHYAEPSCSRASTDVTCTGTTCRAPRPPVAHRDRIARTETTCRAPKPHVAHRNHMRCAKTAGYHFRWKSRWTPSRANEPKTSSEHPDASFTESNNHLPKCLRLRRRTITLALTTPTRVVCAHGSKPSRLRALQQAKMLANTTPSQVVCAHGNKPKHLRSRQPSQLVCVNGSMPSRLRSRQQAKSSSRMAVF